LCIWHKINQGDYVSYLYIDDILLARNNLEMVKATKKWLFSIFKMNDIGEVRYVPGVGTVVNRPKKLLGICQGAYIKNDLERF